MASTAAASLAELLKHLRAVRGLTQEELAERASLSARAISDLERGIAHRPQAYTIGRLVDALGLSAADAAQFERAARRLGGRGDEQPTRPTTLPIQPTPLIGRRREVAEVTALLLQDDVRLLTLSGPGGVGKTRLALQVAEEVVDRFPDGIVFISLASLSDPGLVATTVAGILEVKEVSGQPILERLIAHLRERHLLLLLDNFEHLLPAGDVISHLLVACSQLTILVTSRAILHLAAEHEYPVPPLAVPTPHHLPELDALSRYDAIQLFVERGAAVKPGLRMTEENASAIAEICCRLDGLPLAIELAAARIRLFPPQALLARLADRLQLLTGGPRDQPSRQQTLRSTIDWSYRLLTPEEQRLFARLSVFAGGCTVEAVEAVCNPEDELDVLTGITSLLAQSLLQQAGEEEPRFLMLETIRAYAAERLQHAGDAAIRRQHAAYYLRLAKEGEEVLSGPQRTVWLDRLEGEHHNLQAVLRWAQQTGEAELGLALAIALSPFWEARGYVGEGRRWFLELLASGGSAPLSLRAVALRTAAWLAWAQQDHRSAHKLLEENLELARELGDQRAMADALRRIGVIESRQAGYGRAVDSLEQGLRLARSVGDKALICSTLCNLARGRLWQGDLATALQLAQECLTLARELEDPQAMGDALLVMIEVTRSTGDVTRARALLGESMALLRRPDVHLDAVGLDRICVLGIAARCWGWYEAARELWQQAIALSLQARDRGGSARFRVWLALIEREQGRYEQARALLEESLTVFQELGDPGGVAHALVGLGDVARDQGEAEQTIAFSERSLTLFRELELKSHIGFCLHNLAVAAWQQGDYSRAERLLTEALEFVPRNEGTSEVLISVGLVALDQREYTRAEHALTESLRLGWQANMVWLAATHLDGIAGVAGGRGQMDRAARLFGAADALRSRIGTPIRLANRFRYEKDVAAIRAALGEAWFTASWNEGRAMTVDQAIAYALDEAPGRLPTAAGSC